MIASELLEILENVDKDADIILEKNWVYIENPFYLISVCCVFSVNMSTSIIAYNNKEKIEIKYSDYSFNKEIKANTWR